MNDPESALFGFRFGTVLFWGSWDTAGAGDVNQMIGNTVYVREKQKDPLCRPDHVRASVSRERDRVMAACFSVLAPAGIVGVVSSRYSFFGGGFGYTHFDHEMLSFIDAIRRGRDQGATHIYVLGRSREETEALLRRERERMERSKFFAPWDVKRVTELSERMGSPLEFPDVVPDSFLTQSDVALAYEVWHAFPQHEDIGHIDAIFMTAAGRDTHP